MAKILPRFNSPSGMPPASTYLFISKTTEPPCKEFSITTSTEHS